VSVPIEIHGNTNDARGIVFAHSGRGPTLIYWVQPNASKWGSIIYDGKRRAGVLRVDVASGQINSRAFFSGPFVRDLKMNEARGPYVITTVTGAHLVDASHLLLFQVSADNVVGADYCRSTNQMFIVDDAGDLWKVRCHARPFDAAGQPIKTEALESVACPHKVRSVRVTEIGEVFCVTDAGMVLAMRNAKSSWEAVGLAFPAEGMLYFPRYDTMLLYGDEKMCLIRCHDLSIVADATGRLTSMHGDDVFWVVDQGILEERSAKDFGLQKSILETSPAAQGIIKNKLVELLDDRIVLSPL